MVGGGSREGKKGIEHHCNLCHLLLILPDFKMQLHFKERSVGEENERGVHVLKKTAKDGNRHRDRKMYRQAKMGKIFKTLDLSSSLFSVEII